MPAVKRDFFADFTNGRLVASPRDSAELSSFPVFYHQDAPWLTIKALEIDPDINPTEGIYSTVDPTGISLSLKVFDSTGATVLASQTSWSASGNAFVAQLNLNTVPMAAAFSSGSTTQISTIWEFEFQDADGKITIQRTGVAIKREYIVAGSPTALPLDEYPTKNEMLQLCVQWVNAAGKGITFTSQDGTKQLTIGCNNDGSFAADPEQ